MEESSSNTNDVVEFLMQRKVKESVIEKFIEEKMDKDAVMASEDDQLKEFGLSAKGDIIALRAYCISTKTLDNVDIDDRTKTLKMSIMGSNRLSSKKSSSSVKMKTVHLGWLHYNTKKRKYITVKEKDGGGCRVVKLKENSSKGAILDFAKTLFITSSSTSFGLTISLKFDLGNFSEHTLPEKIMVNDKEMDFTLERYMNKYQLGKTRLYLLSKQKSFLDQSSSDSDSEKTFPVIKKAITFTKNGYNSDVNSSDELPQISVKKKKNNLRKETVTIIDVLDDSLVEIPKVIKDLDQEFEQDKPHSSLVGSSAERDALRKEIDAAYADSLFEDEEKDKIKADGEQEKERKNRIVTIENERLVSLMTSRKERVIEEPGLDSPHVVITVRHTLLGTKSRIFNEGGMFSQVYDWVGSLSSTPEHFNLLDYNRKVTPSDTVYSGIFNMNESSEPVLMSPGGVVAFRGFGTSTESLMETTSSNSEDTYNLLQKVRGDEKSKLNEKSVHAEISRENIYDELILLYKKRNIATNLIHFTFKGEIAVGDGVTRDIYSAFFHSMASKMDGFSQLVPQPSFDEEELLIIGQIITHAFIQCEVFPLQICKASLKYALFGDVEKEELVNSFMEFITQIEADMISRFKNGEKINTEAIMDILGEYSIFAKPTTENIDKLLQKASNIALVRKPCFAFQQLVVGMGNFWKKLPVDVFDEVYEKMKPTAEVIIENLFSNELCKNDGKINTWLHRYIRSCSSEELSTFIRFITGSTTFPPGTTLKVEFVNQPESHLRPLSKTCFRILIIPRQYNSFKQMRDNFNIHMNDLENWAVHDETVL